MKVADVMNEHPVTIAPSATMAEAAQLLCESQVSDLVVIHPDGSLVGVLSEGDLLRSVFPKFDELVAVGGSVAEAFEMFLANGRGLRDQPIGRLIITDPITAEPQDELLSVATVMASRQIRRIPVVAGGKLVGSVARAEVCRGALQSDTLGGNAG